MVNQYGQVDYALDVLGFWLTAPLQIGYNAATGKLTPQQARLAGATGAASAAGPALNGGLSRILNGGAIAGQQAAASAPAGNGAAYGVIAAIAIFGAALWAVRAGHIGPHSFWQH